MRRKMVPFLAVLAVSLAAVGGVAAADGAAIPTEQTANDSTDGPDMGICVVGADSPCNDESTDSDDTSATHPTPGTDSEKLSNGSATDDHQMWIPEDQNHDGEIDERFGGDGIASLLFDVLLAF